MKSQSLRKTTKRRMAALVALSAMALTACSEVIRNHGYAPTDEELLDIVVGVDTRGTVEEVVGKPSTSGVLAGGDWFYVGSQVRHFGARAPEEINREVVAITFDSNDTVQNIERFGLERGQVVTLSRRVTETTIQDATFIRQIIRNIGRIDAGNLLDN